MSTLGKIKTTGQLRAFLVESLEKLRNGTIDPEVARNITKLAAQVNENFYAETKVARTQLDMGLEVSKFGELSIGGEP